MSTSNTHAQNPSAQVSLEYLLTISFAVVLIIAVTIIAFSISKLSDEAQLTAIENRDKSISSLMS